MTLCDRHRPGVREGWGLGGSSADRIFVVRTSKRHVRARFSSSLLKNGVRRGSRSTVANHCPQNEPVEQQGRDWALGEGEGEAVTAVATDRCLGRIPTSILWECSLFFCLKKESRRVHGRELRFGSHKASEPRRGPNLPKQQTIAAHSRFLLASLHAHAHAACERNNAHLPRQDEVLFRREDGSIKRRTEENRSRDAATPPRCCCCCCSSGRAEPPLRLRWGITQRASARGWMLWLVRGAGTRRAHGASGAC